LGPATGLLISQIVDEVRTEICVDAFLPSRLA